MKPVQDFSPALIGLIECWYENFLTEDENTPSASCHRPYSQGRLPDTFMFRYYNLAARHLGGLAIPVTDDDPDSDGEYYSLNEYCGACLVCYLQELLRGRI